MRLVALASAMVLGGCSMVMTQSPPSRTTATWERGFTCKDGYEPPAMDAAAAVAATGIAVLIPVMSSPGERGNAIASGVIFFGLPAAVFGVSSGIGFSHVASCRAERIAWADAHPGMPNPPPPPAPPPPPRTRPVEPVRIAWPGQPETAFDVALRELVVAGFRIETKERGSGIIQTGWIRSESGREIALTVAAEPAVVTVRPSVRFCAWSGYGSNRQIQCSDEATFTHTETLWFDDLEQKMRAAATQPPPATPPAPAPPDSPAATPAP